MNAIERVLLFSGNVLLSYCVIYLLSNFLTIIIYLGINKIVTKNNKKNKIIPIIYDQDNEDNKDVIIEIEKMLKNFEKRDKYLAISFVFIFLFFIVSIFLTLLGNLSKGTSKNY